MATSAMKNGVDACPDLETLAAYLEGRLTEQERLHIAEHLASCETCYFVFTEAAQTKASPHAIQHEEAQPTVLPKPRWWKTPAFVWSSAAGLAAAAAIVVALEGGLIRSWSNESPELRALVTAVGAERT